MDGIHDLGGRAGLGPVRPVEDEPVFHSDWERAVLTMFPAMALAGAFNLDEFRSGMEQIPPHDYLTSRYYEHWIHAMTHHGVRAGIFDVDDLESRTQFYLEHPDEAPAPSQKPEMVQILADMITTGADYRGEAKAAPVFSVGDAVTVKTHASTTHTRRASYIRGRSGVVVAAHGAYVYPDTNAAGKGECPEHVYSVEFTGEELWGEEAEPNTTVRIDVWEPYLLPA